MRRFTPSPWAVIAIVCWLFMGFSIYRIVFPAAVPFSRNGISLANARITESQGPEGHKSITIAINGKAENLALLPFSDLEVWKFDPLSPSSPPASVQRRHAQMLSMIGFMYPLNEGEQISAFCLMATTQTCCYGPKPQFNQFALVECKQPVPFERMRPVLVTGVFYVEPSPKDGYIFRFEADSVQPIGQQLYATANIDSSTPVLDWFWFNQLQPQQRTDSRDPQEFFSRINVPDSLQQLDNREVIVQGYQVGRFRFESGESGIIVSRDFWDGCCTGVPPTSLNSVPVIIASGTPQPEVWSQNVRLVGTLRMHQRLDWSARGIMALENAKLIADPVPPQASEKM